MTDQPKASDLAALVAKLREASEIGQKWADEARTALELAPNEGERLLRERFWQNAQASAATERGIANELEAALAASIVSQEPKL